MNIRSNQRRRTRKDLLDAAARLIRDGGKPSIEEVAAEALVARATAYRYFPNIEALLREAALDIAAPSPAALFGSDGHGGAAQRVQRAADALDDMILANETALRLMLAHSLERGANGEDGGDLPLRQNRRMPLLEAALEPLAGELHASTLDRLTKALALLVGTEAHIVCKDVLQLGSSDAREIKSWAITALIESAMRQNESQTQ